MVLNSEIDFERLAEATHSGSEASVSKLEALFVVEGLLGRCYKLLYP